MVEWIDIQRHSFGGWMMFVEYFVGFKIITSFPLGCHSGNDKHQKMTFSSKDRKKAHQVKDKMK